MYLNCFNHIKFVLVLFSTISINLSAQELLPQFFEIKEKNKYGLIDRNGTIVVTPQFYRIQDYVYGNTFWARDFDRNFFLLNVDGTRVSKDTFDYCSMSFAVNRWTIKKDGKWGILDSLGQVIVPFDYQKLSSYRDGLAVGIKEEQLGYIFHEKPNEFKVLPNQDKYDYKYLGEFYFSFYDKEKKRYGVFNCELNSIEVEAKYREIKRVRYQQVLLESFDKGEDKGIGIYDLEQNRFIVQPGEYIRIWIPSRANYLESRIHDQTKKEDSLFIGSKSSNGKTLEYYIIDAQGDSYKVGGNLARFQGYLFSDSGFFGGIAGFIYKVGKKEKKVGIINAKGELLFPPKYDAVFGISEGLLHIAKDGLRGYDDFKGNEVIEPQFKRTGNFINGIAYVTKETLVHGDTITEKGYINKKGEFIWKTTSR